jgi:hypothetical protein
MGLLNMNPQDEALLALGLGLLQSKGSFGNALGQAGMQSMQTLNQAKERERMSRQQALQEQMANMQLQQAQRQAQEQEKASAFRAGLKSPQEQMLSQAMGDGKGPTVGNAQNLQPVDPNQQLMFGAMQAGLMNPLDYIKAQQKDSTPIKLGADEALLDPKTYQPLATNKKPDKGPSDWQLFNLSGAAARGLTFDQWDQARRKAGATNVSVNTGQKGFDNTLKLRGDFRSEPIYKAHQDVQSAYSQITASLKQNSPAGDLAGATKIMKILDPGSVVRESELGMAMAASGALDRMVNYADMTIRGTKLTPDQRKDFQTLADKLFAESSRLYNAKRQEYQGISQRNGLNELDVLGPASSTPRTPVRRGTHQGRKVVEYSDGSIAYED